MTRTLLRCWSSLNYRYCRSNEYLAVQRHAILEAVGWAQQARDWEEQWRALV